MALWLLSGLTAPLPADGRYGLILVIAVLAVLRDVGAVRFPLPQNARQIPQDVLQRHLLRGSLQFGFELGTGVRTYVSASAPYVVAIAVLAAGDGAIAALVTGLGFGAGRAATPLVRVMSKDVTDWDARLTSRLPIITVGTCVVLAVVFAVVVLGQAGR